jgi:hypothetical protein
MTLKDNELTADTFGESLTAILSQVRLRVDADLTDNVSTTVRFINERVWDEEDNANSDIDLDLAYVTLKEFLYSPLTLVIGRQELRYGNALIIGDPDTNGIAAGHGITAADGTILPRSLDDLSCRKAFDAIKAVLNFDPLIVDLFYSKVDENNVKTADDVNLYGLNASYALNKTTSLEGYFFQRTRDAWNLAGSGQIISKPEKTRVLGAGVHTSIANLILSFEGAYQFGNHITSALLYPDDNANAPESRKLNAFAIQTGAMYMMPKVKYMPTIGGSYTYLSGDKYRSVNDTSRGWNPMFEDQSGGTLFNKILGFSNCQLFNLNGSLRPMEDVKLTLDYYYLRLINPYTSVATTTAPVTLSGVLGDPTYRMKSGKRSLGNEVDLNLTYDYTEDVQFGLSSGAFIPAGAFDKANKKTASQFIGSMKVTF